MEPRLEMAESFVSADQVAPSSLPHGYSEVVLAPERRDEAARVLHEAYLTEHPLWGKQKQKHELDSWRRDLATTPAEELALNWVAVESEGRLAGVCLGRGPYKGSMAISELAVLPALRRRGLGRYLVAQCVQKQLAHYGAPGRFLLSVVRTNRAAQALYRSLGFEVVRIFTRATWRRPD
jgi:ribosomal protein S18 acetylase RimI-like enzyme